MPMMQHQFQYQQNPDGPYQQPQKRFFHNNQNHPNAAPPQYQQHPNAGRQMPNVGHPYQQRQMPLHQMPQQPINQQAPNPFIPLQASRKATKPKNVQGDVKKILPPREQNKPQKEAAIQEPVVETASTSQENAISTVPAFDNRKCRLAIDFSTLK